MRLHPRRAGPDARLSGGLTGVFQQHPAVDGALVFSGRSETPTTRSLFWQALAGDRMTAVGAPVIWLENATHGVAYRRTAAKP